MLSLPLSTPFAVDWAIKKCGGAPYRVRSRGLETMKDLPLDRRIASFEHDLPAIELTWSVRYLYVNGTMPQLDFALSVRDSTTGSAVYLPPPR